MHAFKFEFPVAGTIFTTMQNDLYERTGIKEILT